MAGLIVNAMVSIVEALLDAPANSPAAEQEIRRIAEKQLRMVVMAPRPGAACRPAEAERRLPETAVRLNAEGMTERLRADPGRGFP